MSEEELKKELAEVKAMLNDLYHAIEKLERRLGGLRDRLDVLLGIAEKPKEYFVYSELTEDARKIALLLETLPSGSTISLDYLRKNSGLSDERIREALRELQTKGWRIVGA